jgi:arylsulfatase A-like enzyme
MKTLLFVLVILVTLNSHLRAENKKNQKPNILFIAVDDLKPELGCYGNSLIKTPNIDRLAQKGTVFLLNYCQQAVCAPTRASLMTGKRPDYTKVWDLKTQMRDMNPDILTLPQYLIEKGYKTLGIGKIYDFRSVDKYQDKPSWSVPYLTIEGKYYYKGQTPVLNYYQLSETREQVEEYLALAKRMGLEGSKAIPFAQQYIKPSIECADVPDNAYADGAMTNKVIEVLNSLSKEEKPFFFAVGFQRPHLPFVSPKKYWNMYKRDEMPLASFQEHAKNSLELAYHNSGELRSYTDIPPLASFTDVKVNRIGLPAEKQRELIHGYYAAVSYIDAQIGRILDKLNSLGLSDNTIIVLWGDHGWHLGDHDLWCKHSNFENATRAPLLISSPGIDAGETTSPSEFIDIFPTLCDLIGIPEPDDIDGKNLVPLMKKPEASVKEFSVSQFPRGNKVMGYSIRTKQYRLTYWMKNDYRSNQPFSPDLVTAKELYDYYKDPLETANVVNDKDYKDISDDLQDRIIAFFKSQEKKM